ncbi:hypothetical protein [Methylobacterium sp. J-070]|uniref:hypothetical protein n=1 Tax=Methylobacterium sp. J-070 TaxID=2836650 RepID=UPI001FBA530E|nr:hypothetical protein [Methylobacterium sp. J-070]MCJ2048521.1 hypothetical protein [Methylobacterium sp. J-070]
MHWAEQVDGLDQLDVAKRLLLAAERGEISAEYVQIGSTKSGKFISSDYGGLSGFIKHSSDNGVSRRDALTYLLEEIADLAVELHRDGVLRFAEMYGYPPPPWWAVEAPLTAAPHAQRQRGKPPVKRDRAIGKMRPWIARHGWAAFESMTDEALVGEFRETRPTCRAAREKLRQERPTKTDKTPTTNN